MAARSIGSLTISFGLVSIPVKLYSATESSRAISFNMLHKDCGSRLKQQYICIKEEIPVAREDIVKGYEFAKDQYVVFNPEELKALEEKATQTIEITEFVPATSIDPIFFDKSYYLGPDKGGDKPYGLLVKTSGKTGLHVFVPIRRSLDFDAARHVSELVGRHLLRQHPRDITLEWSIPKRTGKIFMDYNMNVRGKTLNVAYSPRGAPGAPVSMPLSWEELEKAHPLDFRITNAVERVRRTGDRWKDALTKKQDLEKALAGQAP